MKKKNVCVLALLSLTAVGVASIGMLYGANNDTAHYAENDPYTITWNPGEAELNTGNKIKVYTNGDKTENNGHHYFEMDGNIQKISSVKVNADLKYGTLLLYRGYVENDSIAYTDGISINSNTVYNFAEGERPARIKLSTIKGNDLPWIISMDLTYTCDAKLENNYDAKPNIGYKAYVDNNEVEYENLPLTDKNKKVLKINNLKEGQKVQIKLDNMTLGFEWAGPRDYTVPAGGGSYTFYVNENNVCYPAKN